MIIGCAAWGFRETPLKNQLKITQQMGLSVLELSIAGHENDILQIEASEAEIVKVKELFEQYKINLDCTSASNDFTLADKKAIITEVERVKQVIDIAQKLDAKYLRVFAGFSPVDEVIDLRFDAMIEQLNEVAAYASTRDIILAIETHGGVAEYRSGIKHFHSTTTTLSALNKIFENLKYPVGMVFDPANLGAVGLDENEIIELYEIFKDRISYMHLKDFSRNSDGSLQPCACGEGQLNWQRLSESFDDFSGIGMIEYELTEDIEAGMLRSYKALQ